MSIKTRRFLFYSFVLIFLLLGTLLVLGSRGYHLNLKSFKFEATGAIYISSTPPKAKIEIDGKSIRNQSGILRRGTLIDNLLPDTYEVTLSILDHSPWRKETPVESGSVTIFDSVILVPDGEALLLLDTVAQDMTSAGRHMALKSGGEILLNGTSVLGDEIVTLSESGTLLTRSSTSGNHYLANAFEPEEILNLTLTFNNLKEAVLGLPGAVEIQKVLPYPYNDRRFVVSTERAMYLLDIDRLTIEQITLGATDFYIQNRNTIAWFEEGQVKTFSLPLRNQNGGLDLTQSGVTAPEKFQITPEGWLMLEGGRLLLSGEEYVILSTNVRDFTLSPNGEYVAVLRLDGSLWAYDLIEEEIAPVELPGAVEKFTWFKNSFHLLVLAGDRLVFTEIGNILPLNQVEIGAGVHAFAYAPGEDFVQFSTNAGLFQKVIIE